MKVKKAVVLFAAAFAVLTFSLTGWAFAASEAVPETITMTFVSSPLNVPSIVERNHGIFADTFSEIGVKEVPYSDLTSGADQTQALASGDIQFLYCVGATSVILAAANDEIGRAHV